MNDATQQLLLFGAVLFTLGMVGFLTRRSIILLFLSLEMMLAGVSVNLIAFSKLHQNYQGQIMAIMVLCVAACEAAIALATVVSLYRRKPTLDIHSWSELNETPTILTIEKPLVIEHDVMEFPKLTPAGWDPLTNPVSQDLDEAKVISSESYRSSEVSQNA